MYQLQLGVQLEKISTSSLSSDKVWLLRESLLYVHFNPIALFLLCPQKGRLLVPREWFYNTIIISRMSLEYFTFLSLCISSKTRMNNCDLLDLPVKGRPEDLSEFQAHTFTITSDEQFPVAVCWKWLVTERYFQEIFIADHCLQSVETFSAPHTRSWDSSPQQIKGIFQTMWHHTEQ